MLYTDSRTTSVDLARVVGLTPDAVQYRLRRLKERGFILGYTAWFDSRKLGFDYYKLLIGFRNITNEIENEFIRYCGEHDAVVFINKTIGSWDMELDILIRDNRDLHDTISAVEERMLNPLRGE